MNGTHYGHEGKPEHGGCFRHLTGCGALVKGHKEDISWSTARRTALPPRTVRPPWICIAGRRYRMRRRSRQHTEPVLGGNPVLGAQLTEPKLDGVTCSLPATSLGSGPCSTVKPTVCKIFQSSIPHGFSKVKVKKFSKDSVRWINLSSNAEFLL